MDMLLKNPEVLSALDFIEKNDTVTLNEQLELCVIPAPSYDEHARALYVKGKFADIGLEDVRIDEVGNVLGEIRGFGNGPKLMIAAHLDTVFPSDTPLNVSVSSTVYKCPGINDDARGVAELITVARAIKASGLIPCGDIIFCADVCEEGLGDLKGVKYIFNTMHIDAFITLDSSSAGRIAHKALGSLRYRVTFTGSGGHSAGDFGIPNPIHALGRVIDKISNFQVPDRPRTTFSVGIIEGGTSVNSIAQKASMLLDMRSVSSDELKRLSNELENAVRISAGEERTRWRSDKKLDYEIELIGDRPAGTQTDDCMIVRAAVKAAKSIGLEPVLSGESSTDANIPISKGIPAIALGRGGKGGGIHTTAEWFEPIDAYKAPQIDLLAALYITGIEGCSSPWNVD